MAANVQRWATLVSFEFRNETLEYKHELYNARHTSWIHKINDKKQFVIFCQNVFSIAFTSRTTKVDGQTQLFEIYLFFYGPTRPRK